MSIWEYILWWFLGSAAGTTFLCIAMGRWSRRWDRQVEDDFRRKGGKL